MQRETQGEKMDGWMGMGLRLVFCFVWVVVQ